MIFFVVDTDMTCLYHMEKCLLTLFPDSFVTLHQNPMTVLSMVDRLKPDYYISDAILNNTDGIALAGIIKRKYSSMQIAIMSNCREYEVQTYRIHARSYLIKPLTLEKIRKYLYVGT